MCFNLFNFNRAEQPPWYQLTCDNVACAQQLVPRRTINRHPRRIWPGSAPAQTTQESDGIVVVKRDHRVIGQHGRHRQ